MIPSAGENCMARLLSLFLLDAVLLPKAPLPLHIFEPRYREMIAECLSENRAFGVLRVEGERVADVGCTAEIVAVSKHYPDGRMDIVTEGRERFEVIEFQTDRAFLQGEINYIGDTAEFARPEQVRVAVELHKEILGLMGAVPDATTEPDPQISFRLANSMPLDLDFKQALLSSRSESERLAQLVQHFNRLLPNIRRAIRARTKAGGNGHAI